MIACDTCSEWFHGSCVGITVKKGKEMKDNEWTCLKCRKYNSAPLLSEENDIQENLHPPAPAYTGYLIAK